MKVLKAGALYFAIAFGAGFVLGTIRVLWAVPHFGTRAAELIEMPIMLAVTAWSASWVARWLGVPYAIEPRLGMGLVGLVLLVAAELTVVLWLRGLTLEEYFATRDPVSDTVYYAMLAVFAVMPLLVARK